MIGIEDNLIARILLSLATIGYGFVPMKVDFNKTHATNPLWTPHARFHVVWQMLSYGGFGVIALALIWLRGPLAVERLYLAAAFGVAVYGAFFATALARSLFGGRLHDDNGVPPLPVTIAGRKMLWDVNMLAFSILFALLVAGTAMVARPV
jgi:hypothetical protein